LIQTNPQKTTFGLFGRLVLRVLSPSDQKHAGTRRVGVELKRMALLVFLALATHATDMTRGFLLQACSGNPCLPNNIFKTEFVGD
jgi:hypothetical protein